MSTPSEPKIEQKFPGIIDYPTPAEINQLDKLGPAEGRHPDDLLTKPEIPHWDIESYMRLANILAYFSHART